MFEQSHLSEYNKIVNEYQNLKGQLIDLAFDLHNTPLRMSVVDSQDRFVRVIVTDLKTSSRKSADFKRGHQADLAKMSELIDQLNVYKIGEKAA